ncbi:MAG TPA: hypothetical protein PK048_01680, partial [Candidatus Absconditabacterales bacterium]|nr:hypothetical protein [Candidatus Absconditabacterales bacterium]
KITYIRETIIFGGKEYARIEVNGNKWHWVESTEDGIEYASLTINGHPGDKITDIGEIKKLGGKEYIRIQVNKQEIKYFYQDAQGIFSVFQINNSDVIYIGDPDKDGNIIVQTKDLKRYTCVEEKPSTLDKSMGNTKNDIGDSLIK